MLQLRSIWSNVVSRSAKFLVVGGLPAVDPGLEVEGLDRIPIPLKLVDLNSVALRHREMRALQGFASMIKTLVQIAARMGDRKLRPPDFGESGESVAGETAPRLPAGGRS